MPSTNTQNLNNPFSTIKEKKDDPANILPTYEESEVETPEGEPRIAGIFKMLKRSLTIQVALCILSQAVATLGLEFMLALLFSDNLGQLPFGTVNTRDLGAVGALTLGFAIFVPLYFCLSLPYEAYRQSLKSQLRFLGLFALFFCATVCLWARSDLNTFNLNTGHAHNSYTPSTWLGRIKQSCVEYDAETAEKEMWLSEMVSACWEEIEKDPLTVQSQWCSSVFEKYFQQDKLVTVHSNRVVDWCANTFPDTEFSAHTVLKVNTTIYGTPENPIREVGVWEEQETCYGDGGADWWY